MAYSVFRVPNSIQILPTTGNQIVSTVIGASGQSVDMEQWQNYLGAVLARIDNAGNISGVAGTFSGNVAINGGSVTTSQTTANVFNTTATTINAFGAATQTNIGATNGFIILQGTTTGNVITATGTINANGGTIATNQTTATLLNTTATTVNAFGAATNINMGAANGFINLGGTTTGNFITATGTLNVSGVATFNNTINANGGTIASTAATMNLFNSTGTSNIVNISTGANISGVVNVLTNATSGTINLGNSTTNTIIQGNLTVNGTTTTVNSTTVSTQDLNINLASNQSIASNANNAGLLIGSGLNITWYYDNGNTSWTSSENINAASTKTYKIAGTDVLSATTLGANVILSSLQKVGTIGTGVWNGSVIGTGYTTAQVTAVTAGATNTISVTGTTQSPFINLATVGTPVTTSFVKITTDAYGRVSATTAVASGDIPNITAGQITAGTLAVAQGGTNLASYTVGDLLYGSGTTTIGRLAAVASGQFLTSNGTSTTPFYRSLTTPDITGALGFTPANSGVAVTGVGTSGRVAIWNGSASLTSDVELTYDSANNYLNIGYGNINASSGDQTVGTALVTIDSYSSTAYKAAEYLVQTRNSVSSIFQVSKVLVVHDGTNAYMTEYGQMYTSGTSPLISLSVESPITTSTVKLQAVGAAAGNVVRVVKTFING